MLHTEFESQYIALLVVSLFAVSEKKENERGDKSIYRPVHKYGLLNYHELTIPVKNISSSNTSYPTTIVSLFRKTGLRAKPLLKMSLICMRMNQLWVETQFSYE